MTLGSTSLARASGPARSVGHTAAAIYQRVMNIGADAATPTNLVDRVVYSNWVFWLTAAFMLVAAPSNYAMDYGLLLVFNAIYLITSLACLMLNSRRRYLAARLSYLAVAFGCVFIESAARPDLEMEHYFLAAGVLGFSMFHPSERRYGQVSALLGTVLFLVFVGRTEPLFAIDRDFGHLSPGILFVNRLLATAGLLAALIGIGTAYARATRIVDAQRAELFEQSRLSALGAMACNVAHEINTPLMAMDLHIDTLELGLADAPDHAADYQSVVKLAELSHRIATIVRGFKLLSHTDAQDAMSATTVKQLLEPALDLCKGRIKPLGIALSVELPEVDEPMMCRIVAISQVVLNLLNNSIDAVTEQPPGQRWIAIRASASAADRIRIELTDSGRIASEEVRKRMFESFFTTKPLGKGTGLGLSIAKLTVAQHGGTLMFDAASVHTRFVIELPRFAS